jgi:hypothetical protein
VHVPASKPRDRDQARTTPVSIAAPNVQIR